VRLSPQRGQRVLDVGCGFGLFAHEVAGVVGPSGCVVGIERESAQIEEGRRLASQAGFAARADIRRGDAYDFPLKDAEWGSFDIVHARFLLEHLARPAEVVASMVRAARPGGRVVLEDDDHDALILEPAVPGFEKVWRAYIRSYEAAGRDPRIGRKLTALLGAAGAPAVRCDWPFFGACAGSPAWQVITWNCRAILSGARATIVSPERIGGEEFDSGLAEFDAWRERPDASFWYCTFWAEGVRER
jgi:SAM-dependent methyltransferase